MKKPSRAPAHQGRALRRASITIKLKSDEKDLIDQFAAALDEPPSTWLRKLAIRTIREQRAAVVAA